MRIRASLVVGVLCIALNATPHANTYGSVEPIASTGVIDTAALRNQPLPVREAFAVRLLQCGVVAEVIDTLSATRAITTINDLNAQFSVGAGGFAGDTNPSFVYTVIDNGPNAASVHDIRVLTDSLGYVLSQNNGFLLDADNPAGYDFTANYVILNFDRPPSIARSAALFKTVGRIDPELFATDTSGYTQYGRAYLSLQSAVPDAQFISGYVKAATEVGAEYTPIVNGVPSLFAGGAAFPGNDWVGSPRGEGYLARIPAASHRGLARIRAMVLEVTREVVRKLERRGHRAHDAVGFDCRR